MDVNGALSDRVALAFHLADDLVAGEDPAGVCGEKPQDGKFTRGQLQFPSVELGGMEFVLDKQL